MTSIVASTRTKFTYYSRKKVVAVVVQAGRKKVKVMVAKKEMVVARDKVTRRQMVLTNTIGMVPRVSMARLKKNSSARSIVRYVKALS